MILTSFTRRLSAHIDTLKYAEGLGRKMKYSIGVGVLVMAVALASLPAKADGQGVSFVLSHGAGLPVCETLLSAALAAPEDTARQCDLPDPGVAQSVPGTFIDWPVLRSHLGPEVTKPDWRVLDLTKPEHLEMALFALGVADASVLDASRSSGVQRWTEVKTDAEIRALIKRYILEGGLSKKLLAFEQDLQIKPEHTFYEAELDFAGPGAVALLANHAPVGLPPICFGQSTQALRQIVLDPRQSPAFDRAQPFGFDDLLVFDGQLYGVSYMDRKRSFYPDTVKLWPIVLRGQRWELAAAEPACELSASDQE
jgi:hypothetical protein